MELESRADEDEGHHPVEIEVAAEARGRIVEEPVGARRVDPVAKALDQAGRFVLLGQAEAETGHGLGHVEGLPVVVVVAAVEERLVDALLRLGNKAFPDRIAVLGGAEAEKAEGRVGETILGGGLGEHLGGDAAGCEVDEVVPLEGAFTGGAVIFAERVGNMAGLVGTRILAGGGEDGAVGLDRVEIMAQHRAGHIKTLLGKTVHA